MQSFTSVRSFGSEEGRFNPYPLFDPRDLRNFIAQPEKGKAAVTSDGLVDAFKVVSSLVVTATFLVVAVELAGTLLSQEKTAAPIENGKGFYYALASFTSMASYFLMAAAASCWQRVLRPALRQRRLTQLRKSRHAGRDLR